MAKLSRFFDREGRFIDEILTIFFPAPDSYTGEDVVEISCHGNPVIAGNILETCLRAGARLATPGEFTMRAFLNGKMDLVQAEAVRDLVESQTRFQAQIAAEQLNGLLSGVVEPIKRELVSSISQMETAIEFVEEEARPAEREDLIKVLVKIDGRLRCLEESFRAGKVIRDGDQGRSGR